MTAKSISIKGTGCKFGGCVRKAVELTSGDLPFVRDSGLRVERSILTGRQKSAIYGAWAVPRYQKLKLREGQNGAMGSASRGVSGASAEGPNGPAKAVDGNGK